MTDLAQECIHTLCVGVIQMTSGLDVDDNINAARGLIERAVASGAQLVLLPEMFACLGVSNQADLAATRFTDEDVLATLASWAKEFCITLVAGSVPLKTDESDRVWAASLVFNDQGQKIAQYNKIHLFDVDVEDAKGRYRESDTFKPGDTPTVVNVDGIKIGLSICYDLRFPELYQYYQASGCDLVVVPSAFTYKTGQKHWDILLRARAIETQSFVLAANQAGVHQDGRETWGHSMVVSPDGVVLAQSQKQGEDVIVVQLALSELQQLRGAMPIQKHKRLSLDTEVMTDSVP